MTAESMTRIDVTKGKLNWVGHSQIIHQCMAMSHRHPCRAIENHVENGLRTAYSEQQPMHRATPARGVRPTVDGMTPLSSTLQHTAPGEWATPKEWEANTGPREEAGGSGGKNPAGSGGKRPRAK
jgi:hypothetical protein